MGAVPAYIVERYWPQVSAAEVEALAGRLRRAVALQHGVTYLGSVLLLDDDIVQCRFEAADDTVVGLVNQVAEAPYDRILRVRAYPA